MLREAVEQRKGIWSSKEGRLYVPNCRESVKWGRRITHSWPHNHILLGYLTDQMAHLTGRTADHNCLALFGFGQFGQPDVGRQAGDAWKKWSKNFQMWHWYKYLSLDSLEFSFSDSNWCKSPAKFGYRFCFSGITNNNSESVFSCFLVKICMTFNQNLWSFSLLCKL